MHGHCISAPPPPHTHTYDAKVIFVLEDDSCESPLDLIFVLDGSGSICPGLSVPDHCEDWELALEFVRTMVLNLEGEVGNNVVHIGVIQFGDDSVVEIDLDNDFTKEEIASSVLDIPVSVAVSYMSLTSNVFLVKDNLLFIIISINLQYCVGRNDLL